MSGPGRWTGRAHPTRAAQGAQAVAPAVQTWSHYPTYPVPLGLRLSTSPPHDCPYLPGRVAVSRGFRCEEMPAPLYQSLLEAGFRRSGTTFYQMVCPGCRACVVLRLPVERFVPTRSQRRTLRRNADLRLSLGAPALTAEKVELYGRYLAARHDGQMSGGSDELEDFLYRCPTDCLEMCYREPDGRLVGVGICDVTPRALSSVYFYFSPEAGARSLGFYSMMTEIGAARALGRSHYYPGFWVAGCPKMAYKNRLSPAEVLGTDGGWRLTAGRSPDAASTPPH